MFLHGRPQRILGKVPRGRGDHFRSKKLYCRFWAFTQGLKTMELKKKKKKKIVTLAGGPAMTKNALGSREQSHGQESPETSSGDGIPPTKSLLS